MVEEILNQRGNRYGDFSDNSKISQTLKDTLHTKNIALADPYIKEAIDMICHKLARIVCGDVTYIDSWVDIAGYATLVTDKLKEVNNE